MSNPEAMRSRYIFIEGEYETLTDEFRRQEQTILASKIAIRECISLVGVGTVGKTHFIGNFIKKANARLQPYRLRQEDIAFITIDPNALLHTARMQEDVSEAAWSGFELIASSLVNALSHRTEIAAEVSSSYEEITSDHQSDRNMAYRHLQDVIGKILKGLGLKRLVLIFDEFEQLVEKMPAHYFTNLRALRDQYRYELLYMTVSRKEIYHLGQNNAAVESKTTEAQSFFELLKEPLYLRAVHIEGDCIELVRSLNGRVRLGHRLEWTDYDLILSIVGGHGGLLRTALMVFDRIVAQRPDGRQNLVHYLFNEPEIRRECEVFLESCTQRENKLLTVIADAEKRSGRGEPVQHARQWVADHFADLMSLFHKRLLDVISETEFRITPRIFSLYMQSIEEMRHAQSRTFTPPANPREDSVPPTLPR